MQNQIKKLFNKTSTWVFCLALIVSFFIGEYQPATWHAEMIRLDVRQNQNGEFFYKHNGLEKTIKVVTSEENRQLSEQNISRWNRSHLTPPITEEFVVKKIIKDNNINYEYQHIKLKKHWHLGSLLPAIVSLLLCWITKEPITALLSGILSAALILGKFNLTESIFMPALMNKSTAGKIGRAHV